MSDFKKHAFTNVSKADSSSVQHRSKKLIAAGATESSCQGSHPLHLARKWHKSMGTASNLVGVTKRIQIRTRCIPQEYRIGPSRYVQED